jgi:hypothetical protein
MNIASELIYAQQLTDFHESLKRKLGDIFSLTIYFLCRNPTTIIQQENIAKLSHLGLSLQ